MRIYLRLIIFALALSGCSSGFETANHNMDPSLNLKLAKAKWAANGLGTYHLALGFPGAFGTSTVVSGVTNSKVSSCVVIYPENGPSQPCSVDNGETVESLFTKIEEGLASGQLAEASYDEEYGVPTKIYIRGGSPAMADAGSGYSTVIEFSYPTVAN